MLNLADPSGVAVAVGKIERRADSPDQPGGVGRRKIEALVDVAETEMGTTEQALLGYLGWTGCKVGQIDQRGNGTTDDVPIANRDWNNRLDVEHIASGVVFRADTAIDVVLKRQAIHRRHRILRSLGKILCGLLRTDTGVRRQQENGCRCDNGRKMECAILHSGSRPV